ncbi:Cytochrome P450 superfamily protein [Euphorbia peplus]|nr:Cytochrome P450 superfamily protein [Euphorbia peplus]
MVEKEDEMVVLYYWIKVITVCVIMLIGGLKVGVVLWWRPRRIEAHFSKQGIRGPPYRFFIGNVKELVQMMLKASSQPMMPPFSHNILPRVLSFYHHWKKIYGATFLVWFGPTVRLALSDPDLIREILTTKSEFYEKIEAHPLIKLLEGDGLLSLKGHKWLLHRKIITPLFHMENLKLLVPAVAKSVTDMFDEKWSMSKSDEVEIEVSEWFQNLTEDVITRTAFGSSYEDGKAIFRLQAQQMQLAAEAFSKVSLPGYRFFPTRRNMKSWKLAKQTKESILKLIDRKRENSDSNSNSEKGEKEEEKGPKDLLGLMIEASSCSPNVTVHDIVEECKSFFFAGKQTTSNLLTWTTVLLAMHPHWQALARDEVLRVCGSRDIPSKDHLVKLKTLGMILNESLRLYPPVIATIRRSKTDVDLGGYKIPGGTELLIPTLALHHDQSIWGNDANDFNPRRFSEGMAKAAKHSIAFIPFGLGVRTCIGQNLAIMQAKLTLAITLQRYSFKLAPTYRHAPTVLMLLYPQYGAPIIYKKLVDPQNHQ